MISNNNNFISFYLSQFARLFGCFAGTVAFFVFYREDEAKRRSEESEPKKSSHFYVLKEANPKHHETSFTSNDDQHGKPHSD